MTLHLVPIVVVSLLLAGCASTPDSTLSSQRTVFSNPFVPPVVDRRGIGPACDVEVGRDATCLGGPVIYPGRGRAALLSNGQTVHLTLEQRDLLRERAAAIRERAEAIRQTEQVPQPPPPPPPPIATQPK